MQAAGSVRLPAPVLLREIRDHGYEGSLTLLKAYLAVIRPAKKEEPLVRFETEPGQQMQVDFVVFKRCGVRLSAFVATLGYSRMSFGFVSDETWPTVKASPEAAFGYFGGVPREVLFDNMNTVVLERNAYGRGQHRLHAGCSRSRAIWGLLCGFAGPAGRRPRARLSASTAICAAASTTRW